MHTNTESWAIISATSSKGGKNKTENPSCDILTASNFPLNKNITKLTDEIKITINYKPLEFLKHCQLPRKKKGCELLGTRDLFTERGRGVVITHNIQIFVGKWPTVKKRERRNDGGRQKFPGRSSLELTSVNKRKRQTVRVL